MQAIIEHLDKLNLRLIEGTTSEEECLYLMNLVRQNSPKLVGEIGFLAGFSSYAFLEADPDLQVVSFDIGWHDVVKYAKEFIDEKFPGRHTLIMGDSRETIPKYHREYPDIVFDLFFIDGGHDYEIAKADLVNVRSLCNPSSLVVIDDLMPWKPWGKGPTKAWTEMIEQGAIKQIEIIKDGISVAEIKPDGDRCWAVGRYT